MSKSQQCQMSNTKNVKNVQNNERKQMQSNEPTNTGRQFPKCEKRWEAMNKQTIQIKAKQSNTMNSNAK